ncbi:GntR family transcriptional regulator [Kluyvera sichuanensis]|uniref:GntR family transcriptional regulator n=1 Tax=Kluyvera sichuanensis TaxID=2725494 RepID=UPI0039F575A7
MKFALDRSSTVPLYSQIKQALIEELQEDERAADLVLTEASLIKRFHVSRAPIRQALKELEDEGYVVRHRAKGTFPVRRVNVSLSPTLELGGISSYLTEQGLKPTSRIVALARVTAPDEVNEILDLDTDARLLYVQRIIYVKGIPLVWSSTYLCTPPDFLPSMVELEQAGTMFALVNQQLGMTFTRGVQNIWATGANTEEAEALEIEPGAPVMVSATTLYSRDGKPAGWRRAVHRADDFKYTFGLNR